ncbi:hypothetical protein LX16_3528 [Stackebrandtia albiflava]|uniref:Uncharacterized protein n=1 Tax=Stackebrandtia albiflava TaxID=406432 RepID=A0A562V4E9_9ACTN|nr:hypothetical protein [Stackebrandtia albiflava]TWJ12764.1 hypothetical protein LX16_3528 [Stackebrandtia albiflava]
MRHGTVGRPFGGVPAVLLATVFVLVSLWPATAAAHGPSVLTESDYVVTVTGVPDIPGVTVRTVEKGARLEISTTTVTVEVLGYAGEPYAELRPDGLYVNRMSPAAYLNQQADDAEPVPEWASAAQAPQWVKAGDEPRLRWYDHRAHWMSESPPPAVVADPARDHRVMEWTIPLRTGIRLHAVTGTVDWLAPPQTPSWLAGALLLAAATAAAGVAVSRHPGSWWVAAAGSAVAGVAVLFDTAGRAVVSADAEGSWLWQLVSAQAWPALAGLAGVVAAGYAWRRGSGADLGLAVAGAAMALLAGATRFGCFTSAVVPTPWPGEVARVTTLLALGIGAGLAAAGFITMRRGASAGRTDASVGASS